MHVQTLLPKPAIEGFDRGVVRGLAPPAEVQDDLGRVRPQVHRGAHEFRAVVPSEEEVKAGQVLL